ncbi:MAG: hypothetical protein ACXVIS_06590 [Halobacteriota archaeon]
MNDNRVEVDELILQIADYIADSLFLCAQFPTRDRPYLAVKLNEEHSGSEIKEK